MSLASPNDDSTMAADARRPLQLVQIDALPSPLTERVRRSMVALLPTGQVTRSLATVYLADSAHPITSVAVLLVYQSPSAFTRWFGTNFGVTPQAWRKESAS